ncbi:hypothetical protein HJC23_006771 [Cyclotella cryptica]|uniref:Ribosomal RNA-processing protein 8 n=1 Tax=Cyclotella cryptica TaxID=29204 RepID=A0ABD3NKE6_9STRA|eukprot:CCRYP_020808-RA/>CCRYP_020808-RA protein AED:0.13 eAED:-0.18 QI:0/-1/0/1/-1/1/1/0/471
MAAILSSSSIEMNLNTMDSKQEEFASHANAGDTDPSKWSKSKRRRMRLKRKKIEEAKCNSAADPSEHRYNNADDGGVEKRRRISSPAPSLSQPSQPCPPTNSSTVTGSHAELSPKKKKKKQKRDSSIEASPRQNNKPEAAIEQISKQPNIQKKNASEKVTSSQTKPPQSLMMSTLQKSFLARLTSSRFRELNEELYTQSSQRSFEQFNKNPQLFEQYHIGFRRQVEEWPVNPVDVIYKKIVGGWKKSNKKEDTIIIADFGCGDAKLAERLLALHVDHHGNLSSKPSPKKAKRVWNPFQVHSFDLVSGGNPLVTPADIAHVPLPDESVDIGVYCLALMGTNVADFVREGWRVLKFDGILRVAEVRSRFETCADPYDCKRGESENAHKTKQLHNNTQRKKSQNNESPTSEKFIKPLMILDDFTSLMERCGFRCNKIDRSNKMFLFMDFIKVRGSAGLSEKESFSAKPCIYKRR